MSRVSDPVKVEQWSERLRRFGESGQTVADFCRAECVSQASFYRWKKTLGCPRTKIRSVCSDSSGELGSSLESLPSMGSFQAVELAEPTFTELALTEPAMNVEPSRPSMTVRFGQGIEVEIGSDLRVVETVMRQLLDASRLSAGGSSC